MKVYFEWDAYKNQSNIEKHGISFEVAQRVFLDPQRGQAIRIIGAGEWREGRKRYEK